VSVIVRSQGAFGRTSGDVHILGLVDGLQKLMSAVLSLHNVESTRSSTDGWRGRCVPGEEGPG
jgi:hypothetical protein